MKKIWIIGFVAVLLSISGYGLKKYDDSQYVYVTVEFKDEVDYKLLQEKYKMRGVFEVNFSYMGNALRGKIKESKIDELRKEKNIERVVKDLKFA